MAPYHNLLNGVRCCISASRCPLFDRGELFLVFNDAHQPLRFVGIRLCAGPASHPGGPISEISCFLCVQFAIRNLSDAGAALDVPTSFGIPHEFQLVMEIDRAVRQCRGHLAPGKADWRRSVVEGSRTQLTLKSCPSCSVSRVARLGGYHLTLAPAPLNAPVPGPHRPVRTSSPFW